MVGHIHEFAGEPYPQAYYASRRSRTRDNSKADCVCSTVAMRRKLTASSHVLLDFDSWICKLKLDSRVMASLITVAAVVLTKALAICIVRSIICSHTASIQLVLN